METAEEKAKEYSGKFNIYLEGMKVYPPVRDAFISGYNEGQSSPKIKQLEWNFYGLYYDVKTAVGHYMILQGDEQYLENYPTCTLTHNGSLIADFNSVAEAKTAAQADFERRVRECLE